MQCTAPYFTHILPQIIQRTFFNRLGCPAACLQPSRRSGRQMARTPSPIVVEGRISWPCRVSGSSPAASPEVQAARWPEFVPQNVKCKDFLVSLCVQQLSCSLPGDSEPPNGREIFVLGHREKDFWAILDCRQLTCSFRAGPMSPNGHEILSQMVKRRVS